MHRFHKPTHEELLGRAEIIANYIERYLGPSPTIYPVPRGGVPVAYLLKIVSPGIQISYEIPPGITNPIFIDDVIDSGRTYLGHINAYPECHFLSLYDKRKGAQDEKLPWIIFPWEEVDHDEKNAHVSSIKDSVVRQIQYIGEDAKREGLQKTPERVVRSWDELFRGYRIPPEDVFTSFDGEQYNQIVLMSNIELYSTCEHHLLPFIGKAHVAYIPNGKIIGASKMARLVEIYSRRMQIQERIGQQVTNALMKYLSPKAAACIIIAKHLCMMSRGVQKQNSVMTTSSLEGTFLTDIKSREELLNLIRLEE